jgi:hypothetical protein
LNERDVLSLLALGGNTFQEREDLDLAQIVKEEVEEGGFIKREDRAHLPVAEEVVSHLGIVSLRGMPKEPLQYGLLQLRYRISPTAFA